MSAPEFRRIVAVDFDGTLAVTKFPEIIKPITRTIRRCKRLKEEGAILILWTCRKGKDLRDAVLWCEGMGLEFDYINENTKENVEKYGEDTRKIFAHEYLDDKATNPKIEKIYTCRAVLMIALVAVTAAVAAEKEKEKWRGKIFRRE